MVSNSEFQQVVLVAMVVAGVLGFLVLVLFADTIRAHRKFAKFDKELAVLKALYEREHGKPPPQL